mgnify:FL=1
MDLRRVRVARDERVERRVVLRLNKLELAIVAVDVGPDCLGNACGSSGQRGILGNSVVARVGPTLDDSGD